MDILHLFQQFVSDPQGFGQILIITTLGIITFLIAFTVLSRDLSKDLEKLPKEIPTDNLFDPQHFFDGKTQKSATRNEPQMVQRLRPNTTNRSDCKRQISLLFRPISGLISGSLETK